MTRNGTVLALGCAFVFGCLAAPVMQQFAVRPASAAPEGAKKFEQYCTNQGVALGQEAEAVTRMNAELKNRGLEGWELATMSETPGAGAFYWLYICFRRPV